MTRVYKGWSTYDGHPGYRQIGSSPQLYHPQLYHHSRFWPDDIFGSALTSTWTELP